jgi:hypothetical protein
MRKGKDRDPEPDLEPYLRLKDLDPGGPKVCGSGSQILDKTSYMFAASMFLN